MPARNSGPTRTIIRLPIILIVCVGVSISILSFFYLGNVVDTKKRADFERLAHDQADAIHAEIAATIAYLRSLRGLFTASEIITQQEFRAFIRSLELGDTVQALEWIPKVSQAERLEFERQAQEEGISGFQIKERTLQGTLIRAGLRDHYFPVYYVEPFEGNEAAIGFDLASNPVRYWALKKSGDSGNLVASNRVTLVQDTSNQFGVLVFLPVYRDATDTDTVEVRREKLLGFGLGVYRIGDLIEAALPKSRKTRADFQIFVFDESAPEDRRLLHPRGLDDRANLALENSLKFSQEVDFAGRTWSLLFVPAKGSAFTARSWQPGLALVTGLGITLLVSLYLNSIVRRSSFAQRLVEERTAELMDANLTLEKAQAELQKLALYDPLTGLGNRRLFHDQLDRTIDVAKRLEQRVVLLVMDLDRFKSINDEHGHNAGDEVLRQVAQRLRSVVRKADLTCRLGGDEFAILMTTGTTLQGATVLARKIGAAIDLPIHFKDHELTVGASIGIAVFPEHAGESETLYHHADTAMYLSKKGDTLFSVFSADDAIVDVAS